MKQFTLSLFILFLSGVFLSLTTSNDEKDLIGNWKVTKIVRENGRKQKGKYIISLMADHTFASTRIGGGESRTGEWLYVAGVNELRVLMGEGWEAFEIIKLTNSKLVLKAGSKTIKTVKVGKVKTKKAREVKEENINE